MRLFEILLIAVIYYVTARLGQIFSIPPGNITPVWIPSGIMLAAVMIRGYAIWPGIFLGALIGNAWAYLEPDSLTNILKCVFTGSFNGIGDVISALGAAFLIERTCHTRNPFNKSADVLRFIAFGVLAGPAISAVFGVTTLCIAGFVSWDVFGYNLLTWWTGDGVGALVICPVIIVWAMKSHAGLQANRSIELVVFSGLLLITSAFCVNFFPISSAMVLPLFSLAPILIWAAFRFGQVITFTGVLVISGISIVATAADLGPFAGKELNASLMELQWFLAVMCATIFILSAVITEKEDARVALKKSYEEMEIRVDARTRDLNEEIKERKQVERELRKNEEFLTATLDSIQDGISVLDQDLRIVRTNQTMKSWYSHMLPLEGKKCFEAYRSRDEHCDGCPTIRAMESGKLEMEEVPLTQADGVMGALELYAYPMYNQSGELTTVVEYVRDISERKRAENLLADREHLYRTLFENNASIMMLIDPETAGIFDANPSACEFYGYSKETITSLKITDINILSEDQVFKELKKAKSEDRNYFNFRHRLSDGSVRDVEVFSGPITVKGQPLLCSIVHDISERKSAEQERVRLIEELQQKLAEIKTLQGFLPICSSCKKIRDDKGYWNKIEEYIEGHSEALFSHGLCPDCMDTLYGDKDWYKRMKDK